MKRLKAVLWLLILLQASSAWAQVTMTPNVHAAKWIGWRTFYKSLVAYSQKAPNAFPNTMKIKFGLSVANYKMP